MTEQLIISEIRMLPESLQLEVLHFAQFLKKEYGSGRKKLSKAKPKRVFGLSKGKYKMAPDFEAPLPEFKEYTEYFPSHCRTNARY